MIYHAFTKTYKEILPNASFNNTDRDLQTQHIKNKRIIEPIYEGINYEDDDTLNASQM